MLRIQTEIFSLVPQKNLSTNIGITNFSLPNALFINGLVIETSNHSSCLKNEQERVT